VTAPSRTTTAQTVPVRIEREVAPERRFYRAAHSGGVSSPDREVWWVVAASLPRAMSLLAEFDLGGANGITLERITVADAVCVSVRTGDDSPASTLADAPLGSVFGSGDR
jgi:hypothetical protein